MTETPEQTQAPETSKLTAEEAKAAGAVGRAGAEAASEAPPEDRAQAAADAMREEAAKRGVSMDDESIKFMSEQIAGGINAAMRDPENARAQAKAIADEFQNRGAFEAPPERVAAPAPTAAEQVEAGAASAAEAAAEPPRKKSLAERVLGS